MFSYLVLIICSSEYLKILQPVHHILTINFHIKIIFKTFLWFCRLLMVGCFLINIEMKTFLEPNSEIYQHEYDNNSRYFTWNENEMFISLNHLVGIFSNQQYSCNSNKMLRFAIYIRGQLMCNWVIWIGTVYIGNFPIHFQSPIYFQFIFGFPKHFTQMHMSRF